MRLAEIKQIQEVYSLLKDSLGRDPTDKELEYELGKPIDKDINLDAILEYEEKSDDDFEIGFRLSMHNHELRKLRMGKKLRQVDLAKVLNIPAHRMMRFETFRCYPKPEEAKRIADFFAVPEDAIFPQWTNVITEDYKKARVTKIVPVKNLRIGSPEVQKLESPHGHTKMIKDTEIGLVREKIDKALECLSEKEKEVLCLRNGLKDGKSYTLEETALRFGVTRERIRQIEAKAHEKVRQSSLAKVLKDFSVSD